MTEVPQSSRWAQLRRRVRLSFVAWICLLALFSTLRGAQAAWSALRAGQQTGAEAVSLNDERWTALRADLPAGSQVVGYVLAQPDFTSSSQIADYYQAQYALAPRVVELSAEHDWVVGNFPGSDRLPAGLAERFTLVNEYGRGLFLLQPVPPEE